MVSVISFPSRLDKRQLAGALSSLRKGDFSVRMPGGLGGVDGQISQRASIGNVSGAWQEAVSSVNSLINDLVHPTSEMARVIGAVAKGDLSQSVALEIQGRPLEGEFLRIARTV